MVSPFAVSLWEAKQHPSGVGPALWPTAGAAGGNRAVSDPTPLTARTAGGGWPPTVGAPAMAGRLVCGTCGGRGSKTEQVRRRDTCGRCGGAVGKKSGKVWVPCSACGGAGGRDRSSYIQVTCRSCGGSGFK
jgi:DnaJ-class molecular chaperone